MGKNFDEAALLKSLEGVPDAEKVQKLIKKLAESEKQNAELKIKVLDYDKVVKVKDLTEKKLERNNQILLRTEEAKSKLEELCRGLQKANHQTREEACAKMKKLEVERGLAVEQLKVTLKDIEKTMAEGRSKSDSLAEDNKKLSEKFSEIGHQYEEKMKVIDQQIQKKEKYWEEYGKTKDLEIKLLTAKLESASIQVKKSGMEKDELAQELMDGVLMVSDLSWIQRGVAKEIPDKIKLDDEKLKELIEGAIPESTDNETELDDDEESDNEKLKGLRGRGDVEMKDEESEFEKKYMKGYNENIKDEPEGQDGMKGIAMYSTNKDDPYVTEQVDSDEEEEKDEIMVRKDDNMVAVAKIDKGDFTLECYVYNEADSDWYCHHDYILDAPPLCIEPVQHDPGNEETGKGNLLAVGTMNSEIHIWDLDIMNTATPFLTLGKKERKVKGAARKKRDNSAQGHTDAVISLAWNRITTHVLASGGADKTVVLWDLDEAKPAQIIPDQGGEIQTMKWHPNESTFLLLGTMKGQVNVVDCRESSGNASAAWKFDGQIEKVIWNHFNPFTAFCSSDDGRLRHLDMRKPGECLWEGVAHDGPIGGLTLSALTKGLLVTVGEDEMMNVWKVEDTNGGIEKVHSEKLTIGELHCAQFNPDVAAVLSVGGTAADLIRIIDLTKYEPVVKAFSE